MLILENNMMIAIVNHGQANRFMEIAKTCGAKGGTVIPARGTASNSFLRILGLGDTSKEIIMIVLDSTLADKITSSVREDGHTQGVAALLGSSKEGNMAAKWKMINIIVNTGYADDIMDAARKAGATGGTVTHARGTAAAEDVKFLGVDIVPEKEMVLILCEEGQTEKIINEITSLKCLEEPGIGIIFTQDVSYFKNLDPKK